MRGSSGRFRDFVLAMDLAAAGAVVALLFGGLLFIYTLFTAQYLAARHQDADKMRVLLEEHLGQAREDMRLFIELDSAERQVVSRHFLRSVSDLYRLDDELRIDTIYLAVPRSRLFRGYSFAQGSVGHYLRQASAADGCSAIMSGLEDEQPSIYCSLTAGPERFLARVEIAYITALLEKMARFTGRPVLLLARDGFVVTSTAPALRLSSLAPQLAGPPHRRFTAGGQRWIPLFSQSKVAGVTVALLIPDQVFGLLRNVLILSGLLCVVALAAITLLKRRLTDRLMLAPLAAFAGRLEQFTTAEARSPASPGAYRFAELVLLDQRLTDLTRAVAEREEGLRAALAQLRESRSFTIQAVDHAREFFGWLSPDGVVQYANATALTLIGLAAGDVVGRPLWETPWFDHDPAEAERLRAALGRAAGGESVRYEATHVSTDGSRREVDFNLHPTFDSSGQVALLVAEGRDITEERSAVRQQERMADLLHQSQKMESIGRLAGGVAHDFNNMLVVIIGHADLVMEQLDPADPRYAELVEIRNAAERSADLTRQLLAFARKQTVVPRVLDLNATVAGTLKMLQRLIREGIELVWRPGPELWPVNIDPSQLDQILANLCVNARDAIGAVGTITIETRNCVLTEAGAWTQVELPVGDYVALVVSDTGCGMAPEVLASIFEPFYTTKDVGAGTGLGLATVYGAVRQNRGDIVAASQLGQGTVFTIYLPRHQTAVDPQADGAPAVASASDHAVILLVEDEPAILRVTARMLERVGYAVLAAGTPGEAVALAENHDGPIDLLLTDVVMPEMNGRELVQLIAVRRPGLKHLYMSGYTAEVIAHHGVVDTGVQFIAKPFSAAALTAAVERALER